MNAGAFYLSTTTSKRQVFERAESNGMNEWMDANANQQKLFPIIFVFVSDTLDCAEHNSRSSNLYASISASRDQIEKLLWPFKGIIGCFNIRIHNNQEELILAFSHLRIGILRIAFVRFLVKHSEETRIESNRENMDRFLPQ